MELIPDTAAAQHSPPLSLRTKTLRHLDLSVLFPIRTLLHPLLSDDDAARLLRVSRTTAIHLLTGYTFTRHVFQPDSVAAMWSMKALYEAYGMRPTRMCLPGDLEDLRLEEGSGRSPFPSSLTCLLLDVFSQDAPDVWHFTMLDPDIAAKKESIHCLWSHPRAESEDEHYRELVMQDHMSSVQDYGFSRDKFNCSLPPGLLPHGLRRLDSPSDLTSPLQVGSIPSTVEVLEFYYNLPHSLSQGMLPSSLVHLVLWGFDSPLAPEILPPSLQRLFLGGWNHPLAVDVLPASLQALVLIGFNHPLHPHVLPAGLTHLLLCSFDQPLSVGSLSRSLISLDLGTKFDQPLLPHVLSSSLRVFFHSRTSLHPLLPGTLPEGLVVLHWRRHGVQMSFEDFLPPNTLPSTLRALDLTHSTVTSVRGLPTTVKWLGLSEFCMEHDELMEDLQRLPADVRVVWKPSDEDEEDDHSDEDDGDDEDD